ncbi:MAG: oxygen-independent coproporphyrinogen III oxidase [Cellvibrionaceae bacterium]|nr:oxygen-independent coproporphyrinogen III oxidase [Cellvibrionaceae bacterium]
MSLPYQTLQWDENLIRRYNLSGPRYTSYPTAPQFQSGFDPEHWQRAVAAGNRSQRPLSLYVHIPFCSTICFYCGCNKIVTANHKRTEPYLAALKREIGLQAAHVDRDRPVNQLHWGGGTPTYLDDAQMASLMEHIRAEFPLRKDDQGEYSLEIHPQTVTPARLDYLRALGFNRLSFGVQDFDKEVQKAVNRFNDEAEVAELVSASRALGFRSLNLDLIYGLPKQTRTTFTKTLDTIIQLRPDRISLFNYAHMPNLFKCQRQINAAELPEPQEKLRILHDSILQLQSAGYIYIGMDHFALPEDELCAAQRQGSLQRNFQGYSTNGDCDLLAFGVSSISALDGLFVQNHKEINLYQEALQNGEPAFTKGMLLTSDDMIRREVINQLICQFKLDFKTIETRCGIHFADYFAVELEALQPLVADGLLELDTTGITISNAGRLLIRSVCMIFDAYLKKEAQNTAPLYSRII